MKRLAKISLVIEIDLNSTLSNEEFIEGILEYYNPENTSFELDNGYEFNILDCHVEEIAELEK